MIYFAGLIPTRSVLPVAEEETAEDEIQLVKPKPTESGATWLDIAGGVLGLAVFIVGVILIYTVFTSSGELYREIEPALAQAAASPETAQEGAVVASPEGPSLMQVLAQFGLRFLWLLLRALLGCLIAAMGAKLAGAHRGKRT